jgi:hypothetical protein
MCACDSPYGRGVDRDGPLFGSLEVRVGGSRFREIALRYHGEGGRGPTTLSALAAFGLKSNTDAPARLSEVTRPAPLKQ